MILIKLFDSDMNVYEGKPFFAEVPELSEEIDVIEHMIETGTVNLSLKYNQWGTSELDQFLRLHRHDLYILAIYDDDDELFAGYQKGDIDVDLASGSVSTSFYSVWMTQLDNAVPESADPIEKTGANSWQEAITEFISTYLSQSPSPAIIYPDESLWREVRPIEKFLLQYDVELGSEIYTFDFAGMSCADALKQICFWGNCGVFYRDSKYVFALKDGDSPLLTPGVITAEQSQDIDFDPDSDKISVSIEIIDNLWWTPFDEMIEDYIQNYGGRVKKYNIESKIDRAVGDYIHGFGHTGTIIRKSFILNNIDQKYYVVADMSGVFQYEDADPGVQDLELTCGPTPTYGSETLNIFWNQSVEEDVVITILDSNSPPAIISTELNRTLLPGSYKLTIDVSELASAHYNIHLESDSEDDTIQFIVVN